MARSAQDLTDSNLRNQQMGFDQIAGSDLEHRREAAMAGGGRQDAWSNPPPSTKMSGKSKDKRVKSGG
jgi:hypothetical protein